MSTKRNLNEIAKIEKAIREKYGKDAIENPKSSWTKEKEDKYLNQLKEFYKINEKPKSKEEKEGFTIKNKINSRQERTCPVCSAYSLSSQDDLFMTKFGCCYNCYIQYIEDREERWKSGWRPNN